MKRNSSASRVSRPWRDRFRRLGTVVVVVGAAALAAYVPDGRGHAAPQSAAALPPQALVQLQALADDKRSRTPAQQKIDSQLLYASRMARGQAVAAGLAALDTGIRPEADGRVIVDVRATVTPGLLARLRALGADVIASHDGYDDVRLQIGFDQLEAVAAFPDVHFIMPRQQAITNAWRPAGGTTGDRRPNHQRLARRDEMIARLRAALAPAAAQDPIPNVGTRNSQGDRTHLAAAARAKYGVSGAGVKIGVLSDGVGGLATSQASGDLPPVTILPGQAGSGAEGTAMLEIIHDLAPDAQLFFATAFSGITSFAQNIRDLRNVAGCDIIVDDVFYFVESPFHDGMTYTSPTNAAVVTQAVKDVAASGALYFSSAGNSGNLNDLTSGTWEGDFVNGGDVAFPSVGQVHQFTAGQNFNVLNAIGFANTLSWSDPLGFGAKNDYDLYRLSDDGTSILAASTNNQLGGADPYEQILSGGVVGNRLVVIKFGGNPSFLHLSTIRGRLSVATHGEISGHAAANAATAFGVAATPAMFPGPYPSPFNSSNVVETFSSDGPRRIFYNQDGTPITPGNVLSTGGTLLNKPDITAADGVSVTGNGGFPTTFFGTSAAAPHAAAIAALIKSRPGPALTPAEIRLAMINTAIDIEAPGADRDSGAGIVMAEPAIAAVEHNFNPPAGTVVVNGDFSSVITTGTAPAGWTQFATPDNSFIVSDVTNGVFRFYRQPPPPGTTNQAVIFQNTGVAYGPNFPLRAQFDLGNSDSVRKRISVLMIDADFSDLAVCTFWLPPNSPLATYHMRTHTNKAWSNAAIYFYAASAGSSGGFYLLDNVAMQQNVGGPTTETECVDPLVPLPPGGAPSAELLVNGDFNTGSLAPWLTFGTITSQITATPHSSVGGTNVFEFVRPNATPPAGVVFQSTGQAMAANQIMTATFQLGNSSRALKRVTALVHDADFNDLSACTFYLLPGQALSTYVMKTYATKAWTNATLAVYGATVGPEQWIRLDNASLRRTPGTATFGTDCEEPAVTTFVQPAVTASRPIAPPPPATTGQLTGDGFSLVGGGVWASRRTGEPSVLRLSAPVDLSRTTTASLTFRSWLQAGASRGEVQVSEDGVTWATIALIAASPAFELQEIDLSGFAGRAIWLRFVLEGAPAGEDARVELWRIGDVRIGRDPAADVRRRVPDRVVGRRDQGE